MMEFMQGQTTTGYAPIKGKVLPQSLFQISVCILVLERYPLLWYILSITHSPQLPMVRLNTSTLDAAIAIHMQ